MAWYDDPLTLLMIVTVVVIVCGTVGYAMHRYTTAKKVTAQKDTEPTEKNSSPQPVTTPPPVDLQYTNTPSNVPFRVSKSIQTSMASTAKDELRMLDLEREILGDAIRRLYEAQAEGKITEVEREKLAASYKQRMNTIKDSITKDESIIALHELESMQEDLMKLFSERFGELTSKVEELRGRIDVKPIREIPIRPILTPIQIEEEEDEDEDAETPHTPSNKEKPKKPRKPSEEKPTQKTEAERRIESIRSEVEKVLDKLGQMEIES